MQQVFTIPSSFHSAPSSGTVTENGLVFRWQRTLSYFLATAGSNNTVNIFDRHGSRVDYFNLNTALTAMSWTPNGEFLVAIGENSSMLFLWDATSRKPLPQIDTNMKGLAVVDWNESSEVLAVGTAKGNLLLYNRTTSKKIPILGKHSKAINCVKWSSENILACGSLDNSFSLTNLEGDTIFQMGLKGEPSSLKWSFMATETNSTPTPVLSMVLSNKTLFFHSVYAPKSPIELAFQPKYGDIVSYSWFGEGFIIIGFATGYFIVVSTNLNEIGQELFQSRTFKDSLDSLAVSSSLSKVATCGDGSVKVYELNDLKDVYAIINLDDDRGSLASLEWTDDGGFLSVGTKAGKIYTFLSKLPILGGSYDHCLAYVTALREVTISELVLTNPATTSSAASALTHPAALSTYKVDLDVEPGIVAVGPRHWAAGLNNTVTFYWGGWAKQMQPWAKPDVDGTPKGLAPGQIVQHKEYIGTVQRISLNNTMAAVVFTDGRMQVHSIDYPGRSQQNQSFQKIFPDKEVLRTAKNGFEITSVILTNELLIYGTANGCIHHYSVEDWALVNELQHPAGIAALFLQPKRTRLILKDDNSDFFIIEPLSEDNNPIPNIPSNTAGAIWELGGHPGRAIFVTWDESFISTHAYQPLTIKGPQCLTLGTTKLPHGLKPVMFSKGQVVCQTPSGKLTSVTLSTHEALNAKALVQEAEMAQGKALQLALTLGRMNEIWSLSSSITARKPWMMTAEAALHTLDIATAKRIYRQILHDTGAVMTLTALETSDRRVRVTPSSSSLSSSTSGGGMATSPLPSQMGSNRGAPAEDKLSLAGHICVIFGDFEKAQDLFLRSSDPVAALEMRRDLMQWDQALKLAERLAPEQVTFVAREYATRLESDKRFPDALEMYERALQASSEAGAAAAAAGVGAGASVVSLQKYSGRGMAEMEEHQVMCSAGITRMTFRLGDVSRGMKMLAGTDDPKLLSDCAGILEGIKMYNEAGGLYERAGAWEKAADVYIKGKMWNKVGALLDKVTSPRIFLQFATAKEAMKQYAEAAAAYERGKDYENLVRIYVEHLQNIDGAVKIVRETRSRESARIVSKFFQGMRDYRSVVEFLLMAGMVDDAFELAQQHGVMEHFAELMKDDATTELLTLIANYFETNNSFFLAGKHYLKAKNYARALGMFTRCPANDGKSVELAIEAVGLARNDALTHELIDFLMGETDGIPKDAKYIFKLYMSLGSFKDAARTAIIIAREEQALGNYRAAHDLLLDNFRQLKKCKAKVPADLERMLMLLHSYILVKTLIRANEHEQGARMLIRVAHNISRFPSHVVPILTSTVLECHRANFKKESFEYAAMLMRPEYRNLIDAKYKRKIEQIVRRPDKDETPNQEPLTPCPFCESLLPETTMDCGECKNHLPYCIATGRHMVLEQWSTCPSCEFPALYEPFKALVAKTGACPMCLNTMKEEDVKLATNAKELLRGVAERREADQLTRSEDDEGGEYDRDGGRGGAAGMAGVASGGALMESSARQLEAATTPASKVAMAGAPHADALFGAVPPTAAAGMGMPGGIMGGGGLGEPMLNSRLPTAAPAAATASSSASAGGWRI
ncbi:hypothetical protein DFJ73DRAFT_840418 [Zopfochytrium polystomum]|nr:hypothetical protein DFJ73DRAFT_840418 [Zopfochytrium polystomum]